MADLPYPQLSNCFQVGTGHIADFEKPTVSPFFCIFLEPIEGQCVGASRMVRYRSTVPPLSGLLCAP